MKNRCLKVGLVASLLTAAAPANATYIYPGGQTIKQSWCAHSLPRGGGAPWWQFFSLPCEVMDIVGF